MTLPLNERARSSNRSNLAIADLQSLLSLAERAVVVAGRTLRSRLNLRVISATGKDIKLNSDLRAESLVVDELQRHTEFPILTEERGMIARYRTVPEIQWIVDPLDGSFNYVRGIPMCCVSVALWERRTPVLGVIYDFDRQEMFTGIVGAGAWLNRKKIRTGARRHLREGVLFTGFPVASRYTASDSDRLWRKWLAYKKVRMIGSAALSLAYVACGRGDAYWEEGIMLWDVAAGLAILNAAGGAFVMKPYGQRDYCFSVRAFRGKLS